MGKTADLTDVQKTVIENLHKEAAAPALEPEWKVPSPCCTLRDKRPHSPAEHCHLSPSILSRLSRTGGVGGDFDGVREKTRPRLRLITAQ
ncbi:hypothetical protein ATANTOWER_003808 [Ataeniobius toweri]|uniref:Uncharacterized protein n=1 Tax=Ataeniobius toweri TaxID=208326 RepID=A0ABU7A643_9TELE|nr:hypothetical protein [Ataeniobius toweri]